LYKNTYVVGTLKDLKPYVGTHLAKGCRPDHLCALLLKVIFFLFQSFGLGFHTFAFDVGSPKHIYIT